MKYNRWGRNPNDDKEFATEVRKHDAAFVTFADAQIGKLIKALKKSGKYENTIIVVWGDHGWHLGEHAVWGKHTLFEESLHSPLIIRAPEMKRPGIAANGIVESIDIMPTLAALAGLDQPAFVDGTSLQPMIEAPQQKGHSAVSYARAKTIRTDTHRLILHKDGHAELYEHAPAGGELQNVAATQSEVVKKLTAELSSRIADRF